MEPFVPVWRRVYPHVTMLLDPYDVEATLDLFAAPRANTGETSLSHANASQGGLAVTTYRVRARPLDDIVEESGVARVDAIRIDVEGAEYLVLKGAHETLERYHPEIIVELVERQLQAMGTSTAQVVALLRSHGYAWRHSYELNAEIAVTEPPPVK
ncbi:MAG: FkbM family methyltransferase [Bryobacteraceae bacterium]